MKKLPALRFKEFSNNLETKTLGDITIWASGGTPSKENSEFWNGNISWISASSMRGIEYSDSKNKITDLGLKNGSRLAKKGTLLLLVRGSMLFNNIPVGIALKDVAFNQDVKSITIIEGVYNKYILYWFISSENKLLNMVVGTGIGAGKLDLLELKTLPIYLPRFEEQQKIADFLTQIDNRIEKLTKKKELLEKYKKSVMQKIFNQEIRFKYDNGDNYSNWEFKEFGEISNIKRGASPRPISDKKWFDDNSTIGWVRISDVTKSNKYLEKTEQYLSEEGVKKSRLIEKGNLIMSICATIGKPIYTNFTVCIHDGFVVFDSLTENKEFVYYYLELIRDNWYRYGQPGSQVNLNSDIVSSESINLPCLEEQQKIANFLTEIDKKINLTEKQLNGTKQYKKGLLQQMFI